MEKYKRPSQNHKEWKSKGKSGKPKKEQRTTETNRKQ